MDAKPEHLDAATDDISCATVREPRWLDAEQQRAWRAYMLGTTLLRDRLDRDLQQVFDMSLTEYEVMVRLSENEGRLRMAQLADSLAHSRSRLTHTVRRMEDDGLVERCTFAEDRRGVVARLTDKGWEALRAAAPVHVEGVRRYLVDLADPADLRAVERVFGAVSDHLIADHPELEMREQ
ncbi:MAG TPA: MarR family transcriptional regulator [Nocardioides sp.]|nr:MarR family transcriptional regulator [Nocardioides sp.]